MPIKYFKLDILDQAVVDLQALAAEARDDIARLHSHWPSEECALVELAPGEEATFAESLAQADRREFTSDEKVRAIWAKHGL